MSRKNYATGAKWESIVGYSRAVQIGNMVEISGTVSIKDGKPFGIGDAYAQAQRIFEIIGDSLSEFGLTHKDVIRTRMYVTDVNDWEAVGKAHGEIYADIRPATSLVEISGLISSDFLVEIEATAIAQ